MKRHLQMKQTVKQKMRLSRRQIIVASSLSILALAIGITITFNFSNIGNTMAGTSLPNSYSTGFEGGISAWTSSGTGTWSQSSTKYRSGSYAAKLATPSNSTAISKLYNSNYAIKVPATGTYYITVVINNAADNTSGQYSFGLHNKDNNNDNLITTAAATSTSWTSTSYTFSVSNGVTYYPFLAGNRKSSGTSMNIYYDDIVMYISSSSSSDNTNPTDATNLNVYQASAVTNFNMTSGLDSISGIDGALILRTNTFTLAKPTPSKYVLYSASSSVGPTTLTSGSEDNAITWNVVSNGTSAVTGSDTASNLSGTYTYLIYMRDKSYNYSTAPLRAFVMVGSGKSANLMSQNDTVDALYIGPGATLTQPLSYGTVITNGMIDGTLTNYYNFTVKSGGILTFSSTGTYYHQAGKSTTSSYSIPTATWQSGSTCIVNGYSGYNLAQAVGGLSQTFSNFTWNCTKQTATSTLSSTSVTGKFELNSTGTSSLILSDSLKIGGDFKQSGGTLNFSTGKSALCFNGSANQNYYFSGGTQSGTTNVTINNNYSLILNNNFTVNGILRLQNGTLDNSNYTYTVPSSSTIIRGKGSIKKAPTFSGLFDVYYTSPCTTGYELPSSTSLIHKLIINCSGNISLAKSITINDTFGLRNGTITLDSNIITLACGSNAAYYSSKSFVITNSTGYLAIKCLGLTGITTTTWFPVGSNASSYTPAAVKNTGTLDMFYVRVYDKMYNKYTNGKPTSDAVEYNSNNVRKTWLIEEAVAGGSVATVYLQWNALDEANGFNRNNSYIAHYTSSAWQKNSPNKPTGGDPYVLGLTGISSFSPFGIGDASTALPVELTSFTVKKEQNDAILEWNTASEINNDYFQIERSTNAKDWENLGMTTGHGTTNTPQNYDYIDHDLSILTASNVYYRLKQVDYNGKFEYSPIQKLNLISEKNDGSSDFKVWFNPADQHVYADITNADGAPMQATLINIVGQTLGRQFISPDKQQARLNFDLTQMANGVYSVIIEGKGTPKALKFIKN